MVAKQRYCAKAHHDTWIVGRQKGHCRVCRSENESKNSRKRYAAMTVEEKDIYLTRQRVWQEANKETHRVTSQRWKEEHREETRATGRRYYAAHREQLLAQHRIWEQNNKDFLLKRSNIRRRSGARLHKQDYQDVINYYGSDCVYCNLETTGIDHLIPLAKGGLGADFCNLAPCCPRCNSVKGTRPIWVMLGREEVRQGVATS